MPEDPYADIARRLGGRLIGHRALHGGVSANVRALDVALSDGATQTFVVRQHGAAGWKPLEDDVTSTEYGLMTALADAGLPVPRPLLLDRSATVLPAPYLVLPFDTGAPDPVDLTPALERMAGFLAELHGLDVAGLSLPEALPRRDDPVPVILEYLPDRLSSLRPWLEERAPPAAGPSSLLHGDFWPGNVLWRGSEISAVIDWEDAGIGDPVSDLASCRGELSWKYGDAAADAFTEHYLRARGEPVDDVNLALWVLHCGSAALAFMHLWGLDPQVEAANRAKTLAALDRAAARLVGREG